MRVLLDSVILIDHFNGRDAATLYLKQNQGVAAISVITRAEVLVGFRDDAARERALGLLELFPSILITRAEADFGAELRRNHGWTLPNALQAAVAQVHGLKLATRNTKDFPASLAFVEVPYLL